jgi:hypothetical protein
VCVQFFLQHPVLTFEGRTYETFKETAKARELLDTNDECVKYFEEAVTFKMPDVLRKLFVSLINQDQTYNVKELWEKFKTDMFEDFETNGLDTDTPENMAKLDIENQLQICGLSLAKYGITLPTCNIINNKSIDLENELKIGTTMREQMNEMQEKIVKYVFVKLEEMKKKKLINGCIFVDGPGGSGKTYTYRTMCHLFCANGIKYKSSSWMGIAANLLPDGRTMHKTFGLPFNVDKDACSNSKPNNVCGQEMIMTDVFIIDEISMVPKFAMEIIDRKLKELMGNNLPFGGKIMIIGGDFRQILPVQKKAGRIQLINLSIQKSYLWKNFECFHLTENKRAIQYNNDNNEQMIEQMDFSDFILKMGNGDLEADDNDFVEIPDKCIAKNDLIDEVFGEMIENGNLKEMAKRVILAPTNEKVLEINENVLNRLEKKGQKMQTYLSIDSVDDDEPKGYIEYPQEFLHSLNESGLPPHALKLTQGCQVILTRNLNPAASLCNGTRMKVMLMHKNLIECKLQTGERRKEIVFIPKITLTSSTLPFTLHRKQFPIKPCYAMTINKSQGQTLEYVGLDLTEPVFSHGMTYVAFSRVRGWNFIKVATKPEKGNKVKNIVWKEMLV